MRRGFSLVECAIAAALLSISALALLKGIPVATRIATENAQLLAADAVAWDAVWKTFNEDYGDIAVGSNTVNLVEAAAPILYCGDEVADEYKTKLTLVVKQFTMTTEVAGDLKPYSMKSIEADVEWGPKDARKRLSEYHHVFVYRSELGRVKK